MAASIVLVTNKHWKAESPVFLRSSYDYLSYFEDGVGNQSVFVRNGRSVALYRSADAWACQCVEAGTLPLGVTGFELAWFGACLGASTAAVESRKEQP